MREKLLLMVVVACELALESIFSDFRSRYKLIFHLITIYAFTALGLKQGNLLRAVADWVVYGLRWFSGEEEEQEARPSGRVNGETPVSHPISDRRKPRRPSSLGLFDAIFTALSVRLAFFVIPGSLKILIAALISSYSVTMKLLSIILSFFDKAPLWLIVSVGAPLLTFLGKASAVYLRWWFWLSFTAFGGYVVGVFAGLSALLTLTSGRPKKVYSYIS